MQGLANILYGVLSVVYWLLALFVVYHVRKYMLDPVLASLLILIFLGVMAVLFLLNLGFFYALPLGSIASSEWLAR